MNTQDQDQRRAEFTEWAEREYRSADEYSKRDYAIGLAAWQAALNRRAAPAQPTDAEILEAAKQWGDVHEYHHTGTGERQHRIVFQVVERAGHFARALLDKFGGK